MENLTQILEYYPKLKEKINKDNPQIYFDTSAIILFCVHL